MIGGMPPSYRARTKAMVERLVAFGRDKPELLELKNAFELFTIGFKGSDLELTYAQATHALAEAQRILRSETPDPIETDGKGPTDE